MLYINWKMFLACMIAVPFLLWLSSYLSRPIREYSKKQYQALAKANCIFQDTISGIEVFKTFNLKEYTFKKYKSVLENELELELKLEKRNVLTRPITFLLQVIPRLTIVIFGGGLILKGELTAG